MGFDEQMFLTEHTSVLAGDGIYLPAWSASKQPFDGLGDDVGPGPSGGQTQDVPAAGGDELGSGGEQPQAES